MAVKVFHFASLLEPNRLQRFKNEALAAATLEHPHIVPVLAGGVERGTHFYAMRLIKGGSLNPVISDFHSAGHTGVAPGHSAVSCDLQAGEFVKAQIATKSNAGQSTIHSRLSSDRHHYPWNPIRSGPDFAQGRKRALRTCFSVRQGKSQSARHFCQMADIPAARLASTRQQTAYRRRA